MVRKNISVKEEDLELLEEAKRVSGLDLSATIAVALRVYVGLSEWIDGRARVRRGRARGDCR